MIEYDNNNIINLRQIADLQPEVQRRGCPRRSRHHCTQIRSLVHIPYPQWDHIERKRRRKEEEVRQVGGPSWKYLIKSMNEKRK